MKTQTAEHIIYVDKKQTNWQSVTLQTTQVTMNVMQNMCTPLCPTYNPRTDIFSLF